MLCKEFYGAATVQEKLIVTLGFRVIVTHLITKYSLPLIHPRSEALVIYLQVHTTLQPRRPIKCCWGKGCSIQLL